MNENKRDAVQMVCKNWQYKFFHFEKLILGCKPLTDMFNYVTSSQNGDPSENLKTTCMAAISKKFESIHHAISVAYLKENIAFQKYGSLLDFVDFLGVGISSQRVGGNTTCSSRASFVEFQDCIATVTESELMQKVRCGPFISILTDESTGI